VEKYQLETIVGMSVMYHRRRQAWFERWDMAAKVLALVGSSAVVWVEKWQVNEFAFWIALATGVVTMGVVVGGATRKAVLHNALAGKWADLEGDLIRAGDDTVVLRGIQERYALLKKEELPELGALVRLCQREVMRASGYPESDLPQVPWWHRWGCHWYDFQTPPTRSLPHSGA
jgi:hypothetical protein